MVIMYPAFALTRRVMGQVAKHIPIRSAGLAARRVSATRKRASLLQYPVPSPACRWSPRTRPWSALNYAGW